MDDKQHWYDGKFYDRLIAPNQDKMFAKIKQLIPDKSTIIDVGCGTGRLAFQLSEKCESILGLDLSSKNISVANYNLKKYPKPNISFTHGDIKKIKRDFSNTFDFAVITYVIHEIPEVERVRILNDIKSIADRIVIGDYIVPTSKNMWGVLNIIVEYLAGKDHYSNYKSYVRNGGIKYLINKSNMEIITEIKNQPSTSHIVLVA